MRARSTRRSSTLAAAAMLAMLLLPLGCGKSAPTTSIPGEAGDANADTTGTGRVTTQPTVVRPQSDPTRLSPSGQETSPSFSLPPTEHGVSPFDQDEAAPSSLPQAALPTTQGPPR